LQCYWVFFNSPNIGPVILAVFIFILNISTAIAQQDFCDSLVKSPDSLNATDTYAKAKEKMQTWRKTFSKSNKIRNLLNSRLGTPPSEIGNWACTDIVFEPNSLNEAQTKTLLNQCLALEKEAEGSLVRPHMRITQKLFVESRNKFRNEIDKFSNHENIDYIELLRDSLDSVKLEAGTKNPKWNMRAHISKPKLRAEGMASLATIDPKFLKAVMYHELAHFIGPSRFSSPLNKANKKPQPYPFSGAIECLKSNGWARSADMNCYKNTLKGCEGEHCEHIRSFVGLSSQKKHVPYNGPTHSFIGTPLFSPCQNDQAEEVLADLFAIEMAANDLKAPNTKADIEMNRRHFSKYFAHICFEHSKETKLTAAKRSERALSAHPTGKKRIELATQNPKIRKLLGCKPLEQKGNRYCSLKGNSGNESSKRQISPYDIPASAGFFLPKIRRYVFGHHF